MQESKNVPNACFNPSSFITGVARLCQNPISYAISNAGVDKFLQHLQSIYEVPFCIVHPGHKSTSGKAGLGPKDSVNQPPSNFNN